MRRPSTRLDQLTDVGVIVTLVQAQVDLFIFWLRSLQLLNRCFEQFLVMAVGPIDNDRQRNTVAINQDGAFGAPLGPVGGIGAYRLAAKGALVMAPSAASHCQSIPWSTS